MKAGVVMFLALLPGIFGESLMQEGCTMYSLEKCTAGLEYLGSAIAPQYATAQLNDLCRNWNSAMSCIEIVSESCAVPNETESGETPVRTYQELLDEKEATQSVEEWKAGYGYLCDTGRETYQMVYECIEQNSNLTITAMECYDTYENKTWFLNSQEPTNQYTYCTAAKVLIKCLTDASKETCGKEVSSWVYSYHVGLWQAHLTDIECSLVKVFSQGAIAVVSLCGIGVVVSIVCVILSFIVKPHDPKKDDKGKKSTSEDKKTGKENKAYEAEMEVTDELTHRKNTEAMSREVTQM